MSNDLRLHVHSGVVHHSADLVCSSGPRKGWAVRVKSSLRWLNTTQNSLRKPHKNRAAVSPCPPVWMSLGHGDVSSHGLPHVAAFKTQLEHRSSVV